MNPQHGITVDDVRAFAMGFAFPREWREVLIESAPDKFMLPSRGDLRYNWVSARMDAIDAAQMRELVLDAWAMVVPRSVADEYLENATR